MQDLINYVFEYPVRSFYLNSKLTFRGQMHLDRPRMIPIQ